MPRLTSAAADPDALRHARGQALADVRQAHLRPALLALRLVVFGVALPVSLLGVGYGGWFWAAAREGGLEESRRAFARAGIEAARPRLEACADLEGIARAPVSLKIHAHGVGVHAVVIDPVSATVHRCIDDVAQQIALVPLRFATEFPVELRPRDGGLVRVTGVRGAVPLSAAERHAFFRTVREVASCAALQGVTSRFVLTSGEDGFGVSEPRVRSCAKLSQTGQQMSMPYMWWVDPALQTSVPLHYDVSGGVSVLLES